MSHVSRFGTRPLGWLLCVTLSSFGMGVTASPSVVLGGELEDLEAEVRDVRNRISEAQGTYIDSLRIQEESARQVEEEKIRLGELEGQLDQKQQSLSTILKAQYTYNMGSGLLSILASSDSLTEITETMDYMRGMENKKLNAASQVKGLRDEQAGLIVSLERDSEEAKKAAEKAEVDQRDLEARLDEMRPRINDLMGEIKARLNGNAGSAQLQEAMAFLENIDGINETQAAIVRAAYRTGYAGWGYCEAWAERVYGNAGCPMGNFGSAYSSYSSYCVSDDMNTVPAGALVWGSGQSAAYSHVGICIMNGGGGPDTIWVMDNEGSRSGKAVTMREWLKWQTATSWNNGQKGWFGWGYPDGMVLG